MDGISETGVNLEQEAQATAKLELRGVFDPAFSTLGHGTTLERARQIIEQGLRAKQPDLYSTSIPLFDGTKTFEEQEAGVSEKILHWPHLEAKAVVVVMIPNPTEGEVGGSRYFNSVFQELPEQNTGYNDRFVIPQNYIKGFFDVDTKKFIPNPNFKPEKLVVKPSENTPGIFLKTGDSVGSVVDVPSAPSSSNAIPDIW